MPGERALPHRRGGRAPPRCAPSFVFIPTRRLRRAAAPGFPATESRTMKRLPALCLLALSPALALAGMVSPSTSLGEGGAYTWTYGLQMDEAQNGQPGRPERGGGSPFARVGIANFFTLHDFAGYVDGSCAGPAGWTCSVNAVDDALTALRLDDDSRTVDLTWRTTLVPQQLGALKNGHLGDFSAQSIYGDAGGVDYTVLTVANMARPGVESAGRTLGPTAQAATDAGDNVTVNAVPEPGSLALAGLGLVLAGFARRGAGGRAPA